MKGWRDELGSRGVRGWRVRVMSEDYSLMHENKPWYTGEGDVYPDSCPTGQCSCPTGRIVWRL